jgi:UrcA family protein
MNRFTLMMLTAALATGAQLAQADVADTDSTSPKQVLVHYADLDLIRSPGVIVLYRRLQGAAEAVCAPLDGRDAAHVVMFRHCVADAMSRAVTEVDQPALGAYYRAKTQGRNAIQPEATARK